MDYCPLLDRIDLLGLDGMEFCEVADMIDTYHFGMEKKRSRKPEHLRV